MSGTVKGIAPVNADSQPGAWEHWPSADEALEFHLRTSRKVEALLQAVDVLGLSDEPDPVEACRQLAARLEAQAAEIARLSDKLARIRGLCTHQKPLIAEALGAVRFLVYGREVIAVIDGKP